MLLPWPSDITTLMTASDTMRGLCTPWPLCTYSTADVSRCLLQAHQKPADVACTVAGRRSPLKEEVKELLHLGLTVRDSRPLLEPTDSDRQF
jgi:hypothetical protein